MFGVPYAFGEIVEGKPYRVCPVCGERCPEETDVTGEETTNSYGKHYAERHVDVCVFCGAAITESEKDRAWEDSSGACGCGTGEHAPRGLRRPSRAVDRA